MRAEDVDKGVNAVRVLAEVIGPRPSASEEEAAAARFLVREVEELGANSVVEEFRSTRSFGPGYLLTFGMASAAGLMRRGALRCAVGAFAAVLGAGDSRFSRWGALTPFRRRTSRNVHLAIEPTQTPVRTVCLVSHLDSSRSGLMFHPKVTPALGRLVATAGIALSVQALDPLVGRGRGRWLVRAARGLCLASFALVLEREVRGTDVAGANDNASGVGACVALASRFSREPLLHSRIVVLATGSEESGVHGMAEFLRRHDTREWIFINFDGVSADASLRVLSKEGGPLGSVDADPGLLRAAEKVGREFPDLAARPLAHGSGLPYDATRILQKGGRAMTIVNQDGAIPDYHWPSDRFDRFSRPAFERAVRFAEQLLLQLDRS